jgi:hypothetical protein
MKSYRNLQIWQKSMTLVTGIYKISKGFPFAPLPLCPFAPDEQLLTQIKRAGLVDECR